MVFFGRHLIFSAIHRDAHALVGCTEKKQELKRLLITFEDKECEISRIFTFALCNNLCMYVVIQSQNKITVLLKASK